MFWACSFAATIPVCYGEEVQAWHWWTNEISLNSKFTVIMHGQFRTKRPLGELIQARTGPILRYYIKPKTTVVGGYFYRGEQQPRAEGLGDSHRLFAGMEDYKFTPKKRGLPAGLLESRFLVERYFGGPEGSLTSFTRLRYRNRFSFREWKVSPLFGYEVFAFPNEFWGQRPHGGIRWIINEKMMLDTGYYWDGRAPRAGTQRHLFFTNLLIRFKKVPDPDFPNRPAF